jgi:biopolymer transport protein ExbD
MRRPSPFLRRGSEVDMNATMTPMIDVVFLLLVFFVWTASFQIIEKILPSQMSAQMGSAAVEQAAPPPELDFDNIVVRIDYDGSAPTWTINGEPVASLEDVQAHLTAVAGVKRDAPLILHPEAVVPLEYVIEAYDVAKIVGFQKVSFAVNPEM